MLPKIVGIYSLKNIYCIQPLSRTDIGIYIEENIVFTVDNNSTKNLLSSTIFSPFNNCKENIKTPTREVLDEGVYCAELLKAAGVKNIRKMNKVANYVLVSKNELYRIIPTVKFKGGYNYIEANEKVVPLDCTPDFFYETLLEVFCLCK